MRSKIRCYVTWNDLDVKIWLSTGAADGKGLMRLCRILVRRSLSGLHEIQEKHLGG